MSKGTATCSIQLGYTKREGDIAWEDVYLWYGNILLEGLQIYDLLAKHSKFHVRLDLRSQGKIENIALHLNEN